MYSVPYQLSKLHCYHGIFKPHGTLSGETMRLGFTRSKIENINPLLSVITKVSRFPDGAIMRKAFRRNMNLFARDMKRDMTNEGSYPDS